MGAVARNDFSANAAVPPSSGFCRDEPHPFREYAESLQRSLFSRTARRRFMRYEKLFLLRRLAKLIFHIDLTYERHQPYRPTLSQNANRFHVKCIFHKTTRENISAEWRRLSQTQQCVFL